MNLSSHRANFNRREKDIRKQSNKQKKIVKILPLAVNPEQLFKSRPNLAQLCMAARKRFPL